MKRKEFIKTSGNVATLFFGFMGLLMAAYSKSKKSEPKIVNHSATILDYNDEYIPKSEGWILVDQELGYSAHNVQLEGGVKVDLNTHEPIHAHAKNGSYNLDPTRQNQTINAWLIRVKGVNGPFPAELLAAGKTIKWQTKTIA